MTDITAHTAHRPWPLPSAPWVMGQRWENLLFMHWPVSANALRPLVAPALTLDLFEGSAWISVTPFFLSHMHARGIPPLPWISEFPELNLRTYVTIGGKAGVYFFSLDAGSALAVTGARALYHLPYFNATMSIHSQPDGSFVYDSRREDNRAPTASFRATYRSTGPVFQSQPGSLEHFLTERYCLYAVDDHGRMHRAEIHHEPWPLQPAQVDIVENTVPAAFGIEIDGAPRAVTYTRELDVLVWLPERL